MLTAKSKYDCRKCGVCCALTTVLITEQDAERIFTGCGPLVAMTRLRPFGTRMKGPTLYQMGQERGACWALRGHVGKQCSCSIYKFRPGACREFLPGGKKCRELRQQARLSGLLKKVK